MSWLEWIAAALGVVNIALLVRRSAWNYPFGMAMVALYVVVFKEARLYGEAGLQVFFFLMQGYGWVLWYRVEDAAAQVPVRWLDWPSRLVWLMMTAALSLNLGWVMHRFTNASLPYADAAISGASIAAQLLLAFRRIENWVLWIVIDIASVAVYVVKGLWPTAALYVLFLAMSVLGLREWIVAARGHASQA
ncbi:MAG: nicotinamide riboside transporter PnuC [Sphingomonadales bacterium]|nr:nicotinamide riboside transporter PnuC [Sphingomonadales bacterium]